MDYTVYYMRADYVRQFIIGDVVPRLAELDTTHCELTTLSHCDDKESVFHEMQAEMWSPNGEARPLIEAKGLTHTSMSVGDVIKDGNSGYWVVRPVGFERLR